MKGELFKKMIDHPLATVIVVGVLVDGVSVLTYNLVTAFRK